MLRAPGAMHHFLPRPLLRLLQCVFAYFVPPARAPGTSNSVGSCMFAIPSAFSAGGIHQRHPHSHTLLPPADLLHNLDFAVGP